jgi:Domain of unknown function (DUF4271)
MQKKMDTITRHTANKRDSAYLKKDTGNSYRPDMLAYDDRSANSTRGISKFTIALQENQYFIFLGKIQSQNILEHKARSADGLFYLILSLCFYFAFIKFLFGKYVGSLLSLFFRASMRQQQMREQAQQAPFPSLLLNILFILTSGLYTCFIICYYHFARETAFWLLFIYCVLMIGTICIARFFILKLCGWILNIAKAADNYIFIIFLVNKIAGFALLPFVILISFSDSFTAEIAITVSMVMIVILFIYRIAACYATVRSEIKLSLFHYFIYLCAFEIAPLLLIYKVALTYLKKAY